MFGLTWSSTQASKLELAQRERDEARRVAKKIGKALREALDERDTLSKEVARLRKYEPVRDPVTGRWERQRQDRMMRDLAAEAGQPIGTCHG